MLFLALVSVAASLLAISAAPTSPEKRQAACTLSLPGNTLIGRPTGNGGCRYTIQYGQAERWEDAIAMTDQSKHNSTSLPPACPQAPGGLMSEASPGQNEQCLFAVVYAPQSLKKGNRAPIFIWIHGGFYYAGSASAPGLDGSMLATKGGMIVVVLQYRLGVLGLLPPTSSPTNGDPSLAVKDVILALTMVQDNAEWIGGDRGRVTIGGQSSGASLIRAAPRVKGLFRAAVLQSDPMTYGTASAATTTRLQQMFYAQPEFSACASLDCLKRIPVDVVLLGQARFLASAPGQMGGVPLVTPLRPTHYTPTLPSEPTAQTFGAAYTLPNSPSAVSLLITTTSHEAGQVVGSIFPSPIPGDNDTYAGILSVFVNPDRARTIVDSPEYRLDEMGPDGLRETFERMVTDGVWRCASRAFAGRWAEQGGRVWVGEWTKGVGYVSNGGEESYCRREGRVCHETNVRRRWTSFIHYLDPNTPYFQPVPPPPGMYPSKSSNAAIAVPLLPGGVGSDRSVAAPRTADSAKADVPTREVLHPRAPDARWAPYTGEAGQVYTIGGGDAKRCPVGYWGQKVRYDWQLYP